MLSYENFFIKIKEVIMSNCRTAVIKLRQGDDSDFNGNHIIFHVKTDCDISNWKARFKLQNSTWIFEQIKDNQIDLVISKDQTNSFEPGTYYGWLQLIDDEGKQGTVFSQQFQILRKEVY